MIKKNYLNQLISFSLLLMLVSCTVEEEAQLKLWYNKPAQEWTEALPLGNGRMGAMVFGGVVDEHIQFNEETLWKGQPTGYAHKDAYKYLGQIRQLLFEGKQHEAEELAMKEFMSVPLKQQAYQPFGDIYINFPGHENYAGYYRELDISKAICRISYEVGGIRYEREIIASNPHQAIAIHLKASKPGALTFSLSLDSRHEQKSINSDKNMQTLQVAVKDGVLKGEAVIKVESDGEVSSVNNRIKVDDAKEATIWLCTATNFKKYDDVSGNPKEHVKTNLAKLKGVAFKTAKQEHISDYQSLFNRFSVSFGNNGRDSLPTDSRLHQFSHSPHDPQLLQLYAQYGRYLLICSSREGTQPANLQGIWNKDLQPAWESKYTTNINAEMNYWPAEVTNLPECHEPLFSLIKDCSETGAAVAKEHYNCDGWVLHHNTDIWRGAAPINHSNHGIWVSGSGWLSHHLWEHFLFTQDKNFLKEKAYPLMKGAAVFYSQFLVKDTKTGWLISTPSNSPENGGLVAGPTMDHQIIRSLFNACVEASEILDTDHEFAAKLKEQVAQIAPNQIGQYGQLQEWMEDVDDPENKHRHVSHLWGMHPAKDINWEENPELMEAARKSLLMRGDDGTGWSLAWKINFWARFLDGNHAYELVKLLFRPVITSKTRYGAGGGSYANLFDAHPPFQIDGNFGGTAGIVELLIQSHLSTIDILPALPDALPEGSISGVCARGGFELSFSWAGGELKTLEVLSKAGKKCSINYKDKKVEFETKAGELYKLDEKLGLI